MRFLLDQNPSPQSVALLNVAGHDAIHVRHVELSAASDDAVLRFAVETDRVLISGDTDFGELLARSNASSPSVLLLRRQGMRRSTEVAALLIANLQTVEVDLLHGAIVVFDEDRIRIRSLPLNPAD